MKFENFEISTSIELQTGDTFWDLHNVYDFLGLELVPSENTLVMRWSAPYRSKRSDISEMKITGMALRFKNLQFLHIGGRDGDLPLNEDTCLWYVLKVDPTMENVDPYLRTHREWKSADSFRLVFAFQSHRMIEIESETVELIAS
jgi:hypothetical protein